MRRREFIAGLGSAAASSLLRPLAARAQPPAPPVVGLIVGAPDAFARYAAAFRTGLSQIGYVDGQNVSIEYHWLEGQYDRYRASVAELVRRRVAVIAVPGNTITALAAKAATSTIPIVFGVDDDPVRLGLVASLARPGGNLTGILPMRPFRSDWDGCTSWCPRPAVWPCWSILEIQWLRRLHCGTRKRQPA